ncbi:hypothetical protein GY24_11815, partial [Microterricola pindariensis]
CSPQRPVVFERGPGGPGRGGEAPGLRPGDRLEQIGRDDETPMLFVSMQFMSMLLLRHAPSIGRASDGGQCRQRCVPADRHVSC